MEFIFFPIMALMSLLALGILAIVALVAAIKRRPGLATFAGGLLLAALLVPTGLIVTYATRHARTNTPATIVVGHPFDSQTHVVWSEGAPSDALRVSSGKISFFGILIIAGAAVALLAAFARRPNAAGERSCRAHGGSWWPVLLMVPLVLFFFMGTTRVKESRRQVLEHAQRHQQQAMTATIRKQELEIARQTAEIRRRIERMDIHELMDQFDAPRIVISGPRPATIPWLALAPLAASGAARIGEASAAEAAWADEREAEDDKQLHVEAAAAMKLIAGEVEALEDLSKQHASSSDTTAETQAASEEHAIGESVDKAESAWPAEAAVAVELSPPLAAEKAEPAWGNKRPEWLKYPPKRVGEVQREYLVTDEWTSEPECERDRDIRLMLKTYEHVQRLVGVPYQHQPSDTRPYTAFSDDPNWQNRLHQLESAGITLDYVRREIAKDEYLETVDRSVGPMMKLYTLVEFSPSVDHDLRNFWDAYRRQERLAAVGFGAGGILGLLGVAYGLLKVDTWTKGYYTKRLFLGVPAAIISVATLLALLAGA